MSEQVSISEDERRRALLDERSVALASRGRAAAALAERLDFLVCAVGAERFGLPLSATAAVLPERPCTALPGARAGLRGIISHAGIIVGVIDLAEALGLGRNGEADGAGHFVRLRAEEPPLALGVDRVVGLASVGVDTITAPPMTGTGEALGAGAVSGYAPDASDREKAVTGGFAIIDLPRLLRPFLP